jgi:hypothetical protein
MRARTSLAAAIGAALLLSAVPAARAASSPDALSLVPSDAAVVGFVRAADLRSNPFQLRVFEETDKFATEGDAGRFLAEAGIDLRNDVDSAVFTSTSLEGRGNKALVVFEGRFHPDKVTAALTQRGAQARTAAGGPYLLLKESGSGSGREPGAVAFVGRNLVVAGNEAAVVAALGDRAAGGAGFSSGTGLGRELRRVDPAATAWLLVDVSRWRRTAEPRNASGAVAGMVKALQTVSLVAIQANVERDALAIKATGLASDEETRELLEDAVRGLTAAWRMAAQEKHPELVATIRKFKVVRDGEGVTLSGSLPGELLRTMTAQKRTAAAK